MQRNIIIIILVYELFYGAVCCLKEQYCNLWLWWDLRPTLLTATLCRYRKSWSLRRNKSKLAQCVCEVQSMSYYYCHCNSATSSAKYILSHFDFIINATQFVCYNLVNDKFYSVCKHNQSLWRLIRHFRSLATILNFHVFFQVLDLPVQLLRVTFTT